MQIEALKCSLVHCAISLAASLWLTSAAQTLRAGQDKDSGAAALNKACSDYQLVVAQASDNFSRVLQARLIRALAEVDRAETAARNKPKDSAVLARLQDAREALAHVQSELSNFKTLGRWPNLRDTRFIGILVAGRKAFDDVMWAQIDVYARRGDTRRERAVREWNIAFRNTSELAPWMPLTPTHGTPITSTTWAISHGNSVGGDGGAQRDHKPSLLLNGVGDGEYMLEVVVCRTNKSTGGLLVRLPRPKGNSVELCIGAAVEDGIAPISSHKDSKLRVLISVRETDVSIEAGGCYVALGPGRLGSFSGSSEARALSLASQDAASNFAVSVRAKPLGPWVEPRPKYHECCCAIEVSRERDSESKPTESRAGAALSRDQKAAVQAAIACVAHWEKDCKVRSSRDSGTTVTLADKLSRLLREESICVEIHPDRDTAATTYPGDYRLIDEPSNQVLEGDGTPSIHINASYIGLPVLDSSASPEVPSWCAAANQVFDEYETARLAGILVHEMYHYLNPPPVGKRYEYGLREWERDAYTYTLQELQKLVPGCVKKGTGEYSAIVEYLQVCEVERAK